MKASLLMAALAILAVTAVQHGNSHACTVCHSKNPAMVKMHEALQFSNCFQCHGPGKSRTPEERAEQKTGNSLCTGCHRKP